MLFSFALGGYGVLAVSHGLFSLTMRVLAVSLRLFSLTRGRWPAALRCPISLHGIAVSGPLFGDPLTGVGGQPNAVPPHPGSEELNWFVAYCG